MSIVDERTLISAEALHAALGDADIRVFDCTVHLAPDPPRPYRIGSGHKSWLLEHLPRAGFLDLTGELSDQQAAMAFTMPAPDAAAAAFASAGVVDGARIVLYASNHPMWATRTWWMLHSLGVEAAVLDGGLAAWRAAGLGLEAGPFEHPAGALSVRPRSNAWANRDNVLAAIGNDEVCTVSTLSPSLYRGDGDRHYGRRGHIAGSLNVPCATLFKDDAQRYAGADTLRARYAAIDAFDRRLIAYCGGGISATCGAFALKRLGHDAVTVYDGSMSEWASDPDLPVTIGPAP